MKTLLWISGSQLPDMMVTAQLLPDKTESAFPPFDGALIRVERTWRHNDGFFDKALFSVFRYNDQKQRWTIRERMQYDASLEDFFHDEGSPCWYLEPVLMEFQTACYDPLCIVEGPWDHEILYFKLTVRSLKPLMN